MFHSHRIYTVLIIVFILVMYSALFYGCSPANDNLASEPFDLQTPQDTTQTPKSSIQPSEEEFPMIININETDESPSQPHSSLSSWGGEEIRRITHEELFVYYNIRPFDIADVLEGMSLESSGFSGGGDYGIGSFSDGRVHDMNYFRYYRESEDTGQIVFISVNGDEFRGMIDPLVENHDNWLASEVNGIEVLIAHYKDNEEFWIVPSIDVSDVYYAQYIYKGLGIIVYGVNIDQSEFVNILKYLSVL